MDFSDAVDRHLTHEVGDDMPVSISLKNGTVLIGFPVNWGKTFVELDTGIVAMNQIAAIKDGVRVE